MNDRKKNDLQSKFPGLAIDSYLVTSPASIRYNCIAWAAGDEEHWWWPGYKPYAYWPVGIPESIKIESFQEAYATLGYQPCSDGEIEPGFEKIAIFVSDSGKPTHAARQLPSGRWTSKLGKSEDIEHNLKDLEGRRYGKVSFFMKRTKS